MKNFKAKMKLDKISETSSPDKIGPQIISPLKTVRGRHVIGGLGDSYLSFFKIQNQLEPYPVKKGQQNKKKQIPKMTIAQKDLIIENLQQKISKQALKKNARQISFQQRKSKDWKVNIQSFISHIGLLCIRMSKNSIYHKRCILKILHESCAHKLEGKKLVLAIIAWILQWLQPILKMFHNVIKNKYC